jgi:hypothetical protein
MRMIAPPIADDAAEKVEAEAEDNWPATCGNRR